MGGLIGKLSFDHDETLARPVFEQMLDAVRRRGGTRSLFMERGIALGGWTHEPARGAVSAIGTAGNGAIHVVADASLTNGDRLRSELENLGHAFVHGTEEELIAHAYEEWGDRAVESLRGAFACAVWDRRRRRLLLARDHAGIRPLFFALLHGHGLVFASEVRPLLLDPGVGRECCPAAIDAYLALGYVPAPLTAYRRVSKLEAAHRLTVEGRCLQLDQYWDLPSPSHASGAADVVEELEQRLRSATAAELSDGRTTGMLFSGGTGSCALLPDAAGALPAVVTVAIEQDADDLARGHAAAAHLGRHTHIEVATIEAGAIAADLAARFDEPIGDPAALAQYAICAAARPHTEAALAGHGAAALWAGYARHRVERLEAMMRAWLAAPFAGLGGLARSVQDSVKGARSLSHLALPPAAACAVKHAYGLWDDEHRHAIYTRGFAWELREANPFSRHLDLYASRDTRDPLDRALYVDARTSLPDSTLAIAGTAACAAGVDLRFPYVDRELMAFAATVPAALKQRAGAGMLPLRRLLARRLPAPLMPRAFRRPTPRTWLQEAVTTLVPAVLLAEPFDGRGIVSRPALRAIWEEHRSNRRDHAHRLWSLLMLEFWFREFLDGDAAEHPIDYASLKVA